MSGSIHLFTCFQQAAVFSQKSLPEQSSRMHVAGELVSIWRLKCQICLERTKKRTDGQTKTQLHINANAAACLLDVLLGNCLLTCSLSLYSDMSLFTLYLCPHSHKEINQYCFNGSRSSLELYLLHFVCDELKYLLCKSS